MESKFKKGDDVKFLCSGNPSRGTIVENIGNNIYCVNCHGYFVHVVEDDLTLDKEDDHPDILYKKKGPKHKGSKK